MPKVNLDQGTDEWLQWRRGILTATDAAMLLGLSPYTTPYQGWQRKIGELPEQKMNPAMQRGIYDEPIARAKFIAEYGINMSPCCLESIVYNFIGASLDGISDCGKAILEVKSQRPVTEVPILHFCQIQHQFLSCDNSAEKCYYVSHWQGENTTFVVLPDLEWQRNYIQQAYKFWQLVVYREAPELTDRDYKSMHDCDQWRQLACAYRIADDEIQALMSLKTTLKKQIIGLSEESNSCGYGIKLKKKFTKGRIDYDEVCEMLNLNEEILETYRKPPSSCWAITID